MDTANRREDKYEESIICYKKALRVASEEIILVRMKEYDSKLINTRELDKLWVNARIQ